MSKAISNQESFYNPSSYADYLENDKFHHSDKGCKIEMNIAKGTRKGERVLTGVIKRCLTHNCVCSKTGWEKGWYLGSMSSLNVCNCGAELEKNKRVCPTCLKNHLKESLARQYKERKLAIAFVRSLKK